MNRAPIARLAGMAIGVAMLGLAACAPPFTPGKPADKPKPSASPRVTIGDEKHPGDIAPLKACLTEDDTDCYWDADKRFNHKGTSFTVTKDRQVRYWSMPPKQWRANLKSQGFTKLPWDAIQHHGECWALAPDGDTAVAVCQDGWAEVS